MKKSILLSSLFIFIAYALSAQLHPANIFGDHMVLQRNQSLKFWGWNTPGEKVNLSIGEKSGMATTTADGKWEITIEAMPASTSPFALTISDSDEKFKFTDILIGEVWLCSGQSNMEFKVRQVDHADEEMANANYPMIRHIEIPKATSFTPEKDFQDTEWQVCNPVTVGGFTAVGYFFARKISKELNVPIGLVHSSWGGSHVETWISKDAMLASDVLKSYAQNMPTSWAEDAKKMEKQTIKRFHGNKDFDISKLNENDYLKDDYDFAKWTSLNPMGQWDWKDVPSFRGTVYIQKEIELKEIDTKGIAEMTFGHNTGDISFYINGKLVNSGFYTDEIKFKIPIGVLKPGKNNVLVKFSENREPEWWGVGLFGAANGFNLKTAANNTFPLMKGDWKARPSWDSPRKYMPWMNNEGTLCYNAMIAPLVGFPIKGALWYQGESNAGRAYEYRISFPMMIKDWRNKWGSEFPFYWVQLSSFGAFNDSNTGSDWAELREAQSMTLSLPKTGQAVTIDIGNPTDIHPTNKQDVGLRLAWNALQNTYDQKIEGSGPVYLSMEIKKGKAILSFDHIGTGLKTSNKYGNLQGFEIAGADQKFYFARSEIVGDKVQVWQASVPKPVAVRYAWSNSPIDANLYNMEGIPASGFRTDNWKGVSEGKRFE
ncbi:MAG: sialate O-acetylesterase [Saprospiraceae bacterium]